MFCMFEDRKGRHTVSNSRNMLPQSSSYDRAHSGLPYTKHGCQLTLIRYTIVVYTTNLLDCFFRQLRVAVFAPFLNGRSNPFIPLHPSRTTLRVSPGAVAVSDGSAPLLGHVGQIIGLRSDPQVTESGVINAINRIDPLIVVSAAQPDVTGVKNGQAIRDRLPARHFIGKAMGSDNATTVGFSTEDLAIPRAVIETTRPRPAGAETRHALRFLKNEPCDQAIGRCYTHAQSATLKRAESSPLFIDRTPADGTRRRGRIRSHRDLPLTRNRGAIPRPVSAGAGILRSNFTTYSPV